MVEQRNSLPQAVPSSIYASVSGYALREVLFRMIPSLSNFTLQSGLSNPTSSQSSKAGLQLRQLGGVSAWSGSTYIVAIEVMHGSLREHGVVLQLRLAQRRAVASNEDQLGLAGTEGLHGGFGAHGDFEKVVSILCDLGVIYTTHPCRTSSQGQGATRWSLQTSWF